MLDDIGASDFDPRTFQTLLGRASAAPERWAWMLEPWQPPAKPEPNDALPRVAFEHGGGTGADFIRGRIASADLAEGEIASDALPDPMLDGQRFAQTGGRPPPRRGAGLPETPLQELITRNFQSHQRALAEIEPNNRFVTGISAPDWRPTAADVAKIHQELLMARQRAAGAIDTQPSGIGIGPFAGESVPARSEKRNFNNWERAEIDRLGKIYGCHTCGTREPEDRSGRFVPDHQRPTSVNPTGEAQRLFPQCLSCSRRQGGLISREVQRREEP